MDRPNENNMKIRSTMRLLIMTIIITLCSCTYKREQWVCSCNEQELVRDFIKSTTKDSNNMSDEEMEDVIYELWKTGVQSSCHQEIFVMNQHNSINWNKSSLDSCEMVILFR